MNLVNPVGLSLPHHKPGVAPVTPPRTATPQAADEHIRVVAPLQVQLPNPYAVPSCRRPRSHARRSTGWLWVPRVPVLLRGDRGRRQGLCGCKLYWRL